MRQPVLSLIQVFQKMLETEMKHELLMEIYKESLRGQYGWVCVFFWRLMKILWKDNIDQSALSFMIFLLYLGFSFNFQSMKTPVEQIAFYQNPSVISPGLLDPLIRRDSGRLAKETFMSNPIVSSKQWFNGLKITNWLRKPSKWCSNGQFGS